MRAQQRFNHIPIEQVRFFDGLACERIQKQGFEDAAQPVVRRDIETFFAALQNLGGEFVTHQMLEDHFERGVADLKILREASRKLDDAVIEKRRANL